MAVLYLTKDLMFLSRAAGAGAKLGVSVQGLGSVDALVQHLEAGDAELVLVDLSLPQLDVVALMDELRGRGERTPRVVAYAPHVHIERLKAARRAGCGEVLTRGQFDKQLDRILDGCGRG